MAGSSLKSASIWETPKRKEKADYKPMSIGWYLSRSPPTSPGPVPGNPAALYPENQGIVRTPTPSRKKWLSQHHIFLEPMPEEIPETVTLEDTPEDCQCDHTKSGATDDKAQGLGEGKVPKRCFDSDQNQGSTPATKRPKTVSFMPDASLPSSSAYDSPKVRILKMSPMSGKSARSDKTLSTPDSKHTSSSGAYSMDMTPGQKRLQGKKRSRAWAGVNWDPSTMPHRVGKNDLGVDSDEDCIMLD